MEKTPAYNLLTTMVKNLHHWDANIAQYLINIVGESTVHHFRDIKAHWKNWNIETNLWGHIYLANIHGIYSDNCSIIALWKQILPCTESPVFDFFYKHSPESYRVGINALLALHNPVEWYHLYCAQPLRYQLNSQEELLLVRDLIEMGSQNTLVLSAEDSKMAGYFLGLVTKNIRLLCDSKNNIYKSMSDKILNSHSIKELMERGEQEDIYKLFEGHSLLSIIKKSQSKANLSTTMLSDFMPMAEAHRWIAAYRKFNLISFFAPLLKAASGYSLRDIEKFLDHHAHIRNVTYSSRAQKEMVSQIDYLSPALKAHEMTARENLVWNLFIIKCNNIELFKKSLQFVDIPPRDEHSQHYYSLFDSHISGENFSWHQPLAEYRSDQLQHHLDDKIDDVCVNKI